jgi:outer membrane protein assembly factor BamB
MIRLMRLITICTLLAATLAVYAADWPQFLGPNANGVAPDTGINKDWNARPPQQVWKVPMGDNGYAGPSVADGKVFIIDHAGDKDVVKALNFANGQEVWNYSYTDAANHNYGFSQSTPVCSGGKVYTVSCLGQVHCLNASNGQKIWSVDMKSQFGGRPPKWRYANSVLIDGNKCILVPGGPSATVAAVDKDTGAPIWKGGTGEIGGYSTPVKATLDGRDQYVVFTEGHCIGVDANSGSTLWKYPWKTNYDVNAATPVVGAPYVFITSNYGVGCALLQVASGRATQAWMNKAIQSHFNSPIFYNGCLWGISGNLVCMDSRNGNVLWQQGGFEKGGLVGVDDCIIAVSGNSGDVVLCDAAPTGFKERGRIKPLGDQSWTAPIVANGKLLIRNKQALACLDIM